MFKLVVLICLKIALVKCFYISRGDFNNDTVEEIQNALCTISTKEIEASANATITRQLKGVCTSHEFNVKIDKLQTKILQEIDDIKYILEANGFKIPESVPNFKLSDDNLKNNNLLYKSGNGTKIPTRTEEILIHNNTISDTDEGSVYIFYWKITDVQQLLRKRETYILSPSFQVLGHDLRLNFYPNHLETGYFGIELKPNSNGFLKKHKITILNQFDATNDFYSSILYALSEKRVFRAAEANLRMEGFVIDDAMIVRIEIFINS